MQMIVTTSQDYTAALSELNVVMTGEVLRHDQSEKRRKVLDWLSTKDEWRKHKDFHKYRIDGASDWFLKSEPFRAWRKGEGSHVLLCHGLGRQSSETADFTRRLREIIHYVWTSANVNNAVDA